MEMMMMVYVGKRKKEGEGERIYRGTSDYLGWGNYSIAIAAHLNVRFFWTEKGETKKGFGLKRWGLSSSSSV